MKKKYTFLVIVMLFVAFATGILGGQVLASNGTSAIRIVQGDILLENGSLRINNGSLNITGVLFVNGVSDYVNVGNFTFVDGGLPYGSLSVFENSNETVIAASGTKVQYTFFNVADVESNADVDPVEDHIKIEKAGTYFVTSSIQAESVVGHSAVWAFSIYVNNGTTLKTNLHAHRVLSGGGDDLASVSISGIASFNLDDTIELWVTNESNSQNIIIEDVSLNVVQIGS